MLKYRKYLLLLITIAWFIFMTVLSHQPGSQTVELSSKVVNEIAAVAVKKPTGRLHVFTRESAHLVCFFILSVLSYFTCNEWRVPFRYVFALLIFWCYCDEWTKQFVPGRHYSSFDVVLNLIGASAGALLPHLIRKTLIN